MRKGSYRPTLLIYKAVIDRILKASKDILLAVLIVGRHSPEPSWNYWYSQLSTLQNLVLDIVTERNYI